MVINPYADTIDLPAGTPQSTINAILAIRDRAFSRPNQPEYDPWAAGINQILQNVTGLAGNYINKNFIDLPYQQELNTYKTDEDIRRTQAVNELLTQALQVRDQNKWALAQEQAAAQGSAMGAFLDNQAALTQPAFTTDTGPTAPYGAFEDATAASPGPTFEAEGYQPTQAPAVPSEPSTELQGDIAPTGRSRIIKTSPGFTPSTADVLRALAANPINGPLYAGLMEGAFSKNQNLANLMTPEKLRAQEILDALKKAQAEATTQNAQTNAGRLAGQLPVWASQVDRNNADIERIRQVAATAQGQNEIRSYVVDRLAQGATLDEITPYLAALSGKPVTQGNQAAPYGKNLQAYIDMLNEPDPAKRAILREALQTQGQFNAGFAAQRAQAVLPTTLAGRQIPKINESLQSMASFVGDTQTLQDAVDTLDKAGLLPKNPTKLSEWSTFLSRQRPSLWVDPEVQGAYRTVNQLLHALLVTYDRTIQNEIGGPRIREAFNLPADPSMLSRGQFDGLFRYFLRGAERMRGQLDKRRQEIDEGIGITPGTTPATTKKSDYIYNPATGQVEPVR